MTIERSGDDWILRLIEADGKIACRLGLGSWSVSDGDETGAGVTVAASGGWVGPTSFRAEVIFLETPHRLRIDCSLAGDTFTADWRTTPLHVGPLAQLRQPMPGVPVMTL